MTAITSLEDLVKPFFFKDPVKPKGNNKKKFNSRGKHSRLIRQQIQVLADGRRIIHYHDKRVVK